MSRAQELYLLTFENSGFTLISYKILRWFPSRVRDHVKDFGEAAKLPVRVEIHQHDCCTLQQNHVVLRSPVSTAS